MTGYPPSGGAPSEAEPPPATGDEGVDAALREFAAAAHDVDGALDAGRRLHEVLQDRLDHLDRA